MTRSACFHWLAPLVVLLVATWMLDGVGLDLRLADHIYTLLGSNWSLKNNWLLEYVIHKGGRAVIAIMLLACLAALISSWLLPRMYKYRPGLIFLFGAVAVSLLLVSTLKGLTHIDCPWSYQRYGGDRANGTIFAAIFGAGSGRCFPSGHASGGYAWIALYFYCCQFKPNWRLAAMAISLSLGAIFGIAQQLRGAHLLSHDLWSLAICWYTALAGYNWLALHMRKQERGQFQAAAFSRLNFSTTTSSASAFR